MTKAGKVFKWGAAGAGILLVLLIAAAVVLPRLLDSDAIGRSLATELEARYHISVERIKFRFLPFPRLEMYGVATTLPKTLAASARTVSVNPKILPLFTGKFIPAEIELLSPMISARLPENTPENTAKSSSLRLLNLKDRISWLQTVVIPALPGVVIDARNGGLELYCGQKRVFFFEELDLRSSLHGQRVDFELTSGRSNLWRALSLTGWVDLGTLKSSEELNLTGGNPGDLMRFFNTPASARMGDSQIDLRLVLKTSGPASARADFTASIPHLTLDSGGQNTVMSNGALAGALNIDISAIDISLSHFQFDYPRLNLTANCTERFPDHSITLNIDGSETDAATVRTFMLAVNSDSKLTRRVFEIIREGEIPAISFSARANKASDLIKLENLTIKGSIEKGVVFAPKADLVVFNVSGNVLVEDGVLSATSVSGRIAGSSTRDGELRIGLRHDDPLFHLDLPISADLSELPDVLNRVVNNRAFRKELALAGDIGGKAQGRLYLGESLDALAVRVESGPFHLFGRYGRLPAPVDLRGSSFLMDGNKLSVSSLAGKSGSSSFEGVGLSYDWGGAKSLEIDTEAGSVVSMDLLAPLLKAHQYWKNFLDAPPKGLLRLNSIRFSGPQADHPKWVINAKGQVENVIFQNNKLNSPLTLKSGNFELDRDQIKLEGIDAVLADSSLSISGSISGYLDQPNEVDLQLAGRLGPEGNKIAASLAGLPQPLGAISNLTLQSSRLTWSKGQKTSFKGEILISADPPITIGLVNVPRKISIESADLYVNGNTLNVKSASISWNGSRLSLTGSVAITEGLYLVDMNGVADSFDLGDILRNHDSAQPPSSPQKSWEIPVAGSIRMKSECLSYGKVSWRPAEADVVLSPNSIDIKLNQANLCGISTPCDILITPEGLNISMSLSAKDQNLESALDCVFNIKHWISGTYTLTGNVATGKGDENTSAQPPPAADKLAPHAEDHGAKTGNQGTRPRPPHQPSVIQTTSASLSPQSSVVHIDLRDDTTKSPGAGPQILSPSSPAALADLLEGDVEFKAKHGRIFRFETLGKIISLLSISEIYRGVLPDLLHEGCEYKSIEAKGKIKNGKLVLSDSVVKGPCIKMVFSGEIDLVRQKVDVIALVAPLRTVERVVDATPIMGKVLKDALVTLPVRISGDLSDPSVVLLSPSAAGEELFGVMKRIFKLPLSIFQPSAEKQPSENSEQ